mmetsp:Transcript_15367/g.44397  ORF Transcript_15367/g.44397 Transcript_15367/m.44397 type:complete len:319 (+) Transcript_15367:2173-3129(+)
MDWVLRGRHRARLRHTRTPRWHGEHHMVRPGVLELHLHRIGVGLLPVRQRLRHGAAVPAGERLGVRGALSRRGVLDAGAVLREELQERRLPDQARFDGPRGLPALLLPEGRTQRGQRAIRGVEWRLRAVRHGLGDLLVQQGGRVRERRGLQCACRVRLCARPEGEQSHRQGRRALRHRARGLRRFQGQRPRALAAGQRAVRHGGAAGVIVGAGLAVGCRSLRAVVNHAAVVQHSHRSAGALPRVLVRGRAVRRARRLPRARAELDGWHSGPGLDAPGAWKFPAAAVARGAPPGGRRELADAAEPRIECVGDDPRLDPT